MMALACLGMLTSVMTWNARIWSFALVSMIIESTQTNVEDEKKCHNHTYQRRTSKLVIET
jgi:hypothetical protein